MKMAVTVGTEEEFIEWKNGPLASMAINDSIVAPTGIDTERMDWPEPAHHGDHGDEHGEEDHDDHAEEGGEDHGDEHSH